GPDASAIVIAVNIATREFGQPLALVRESARDRAKSGVVVLDDRHQDRRRSARPFGAKRMAALEHAPTIVAAPFDQVDLLPQILPDVPAPQITPCLVEAELPRLAQSIRPDFRSSARRVDKRIVFWNSVIPARIGVVDVDAQHLSGKRTDVLPSHVLVGN